MASEAPKLKFDGGEGQSLKIMCTPLAPYKRGRGDTRSADPEKTPAPVCLCCSILYESGKVP